MQEKPRHKFTTLRDHFRLAATAGLAWAPTLYLLTPQVGLKAALGMTALFGALSAGLYVPVMRTCVSNIYNRRFQAKNGCLPPPPALNEIVHDVSRAAGYEPLPKVHIIPGEEVNAAMAGQEMYFTSHALFTLDREEQKFVAAHEISHEGAHDSAASSLLWLPHLYSWTMLVYSAFTLLDLMSGGPRAGDAPTLHEVLNITTTYSANFLWQAALWLSVARAHEYRADRNAAALTGNQEAGISMLGKVHQERGDDIFSSLITTHPHPEDRIARLKKEAAGMNPPIP
jgi:Zn-dependent protease with chaperone function